MQIMLSTKRLNIIQKYTNQTDICPWITNISTDLHAQLLARMTASHLRLCRNFQNSIYFMSIFYLLSLLFLPLSGRCTSDSSGRFSAGSWRIVLIIAAILVAIIIFTIISATLVAYWGRCGNLFKRNNKVHPLPTNAFPQWWSYSCDVFTTWLILTYCDVIFPMLICSHSSDVNSTFRCNVLLTEVNFCSFTEERKYEIDTIFLEKTWAKVMIKEKCIAKIEGLQSCNWEIWRLNVANLIILWKNFTQC